MLILSIETSCDETSVSVLENKEVLSNITFSQIYSHKKYNGVFPGLAAKLHVNNIQKVLITSLKKTNFSWNDIDVISYTEKPGMVICLQIGKIVAQTISLYLKKPIIPCNHLHGHIFSTLINKKENWKFPSLALVISGGHTQIYLLKDYFDIELLGETLDDAVGEFLDKSSLILGYDYPGGPIIENLAKNKKKPKLIKLPFPLDNKGLDFSFSGLKNEIFKLVEMRNKGIFNFDDGDIAYSIQIILSRIFVKKLSNYLLFSKNIKSIIIGGGVISNFFFREYIIKNINLILEKNKLPAVSYFFPDKIYSTDNAAMIGILTYYKLKKIKNS